jgi:starch synthase
VNGVEYKHYDPRLDPFLAVNYTKDELEKKQQCKQDLLSVCEFESQPQVPLVGMIAPFDKQKGLGLILQSLQQMLGLDLRFVLLNDNGAAEPDDMKRLAEVQRTHEARFRWYAEHDQEMVHKILAGADMLLIPSKSEPCGEIQMYSLKYGTIPLVRATGGLDDTITEFHHESGKGNGFKFSEYTPEALLAMLREALAVYQNHSLWELLQANAMRVDYSWVYSAKKYQDLYKVAMGKANLSPILSR